MHGHVQSFGIAALRSLGLVVLALVAILVVLPAALVAAGT
jgi:hypothetical protein